MSLRDNWVCLREMRLQFPGLYAADQSIPDLQSQRGSNSGLAQHPIRSDLRFFGPQLDRHLRRQIFLSGIFQEAHQPRDRHSHIFLDRGNRQLAIMAIHDNRAARTVSTSE